MVTDTFLAELGQLNTAKMLQADELSEFVKHNRNKNWSLDKNQERNIV